MAFTQWVLKKRLGVENLSQSSQFGCSREKGNLSGYMKKKVSK